MPGRWRDLRLWAIGLWPGMWLEQGEKEMPNQEQSEFDEFLQAVIDNGHLDGSALGIARLVLDRGQNVLSQAQAHVFQVQVLDEYAQEDCDRCQAEIPWSEKYNAYHNGGLCSYCEHMQGRMEAE